MRSWAKIEGGRLAPAGFLASAVHARIKRDPKMLDLALIYSEGESTTAAGVFTTNRVAAAPVALSRQQLKGSRGHARAIVVNSGNANACTGASGIKSADAAVKATSRVLRIPPEQVLIASTGVIGVPLRMDAVTSKLSSLASALSPGNFPNAAQAIMTTDTFPKICALQGTIGGRCVRLLGIAKGAGMIHPRMATMLAFIMTDAAVRATDLQRMLISAVDSSFNHITVDGDTSTNDTVIALANGLSGVAVERRTGTASWLLTGLREVCGRLAQMIVKDGEGARKFITVEVVGARTEADADRMARAIANSPLVKTAMAGGDPNWGRILCAAGYSGAHFDPAKVEIRVNSLLLCRKGMDAGFNEAAARAELGQPELTLRIDLHQGRATTRIWTCDLTHDYITINASYRT